MRRRVLSAKRFAGFSVIFLAAFLCASLSSAAQSPAGPDKIGPWYRELQVDAFLSVTYGCNFNDPPSGRMSYRVFDTRAQRLRLDLASLTLQKPAAGPGDVGFRIDMGGGESQPPATAARGFFRSATTGNAGHFDMEQVYVTYTASGGRGLRFDVGKFYAPIGYESVDRYDAYNDNVSRSFLFGYSAPFTTTGIKVSYPISTSWSAMVMVVQGWDVVSDNNGGKTVGGQVVWSPDSDATYTFTYLGGPEQTGNDSNWRNVHDFCGTWKATPALTLGLNADYGHERAALGPRQSASWYGAAGYVTFAFTDRFQVALRAELFDDPQGARTGTAQSLRELTISPTWRVGRHFIVRGDLREDWSNKDVFQKAGGFTDLQPTILFNVLFVD
ncbi:MAG: porin [Acidobacteriota bacterium]